VISAEAAESGKPVVYFEEPAALLMAISEMPEDSQMRMFEQVLDIIENDPEQPRRILAQWAGGDADGLAGAFHGEGEWPDETVRRVMLLERNAEWLAKLVDIMDTQTGVYFVAVGVGHLVGEDSIIRGLELSGHDVSRE